MNRNRRSIVSSEVRLMGASVTFFAIARPYGRMSIETIYERL